MIVRPALLRSLLLLVLGAALSPWPADGQQVVRGYLTETGSGRPIEGAMVVALSGGRAVTRALSAADGSFSIDLRQPGTYELRVDRIGYASTFSGAFDVPAGATVDKRIETVARPVALRGLEVVGDARCRRVAGDGLAVATLWEEARKALAAAAWTSERELYRFSWIRYVRQLDAKGSRVLDEQRRRSSVYTPSPFRSVHLDTLGTYGFVRERAGEVLYAAPDATVLLSPSFLDGHCFALDRRVEDDRHLVGLRFEPLPSRRLPDVRGVLWLDEDTGRLRSLEYEYVNLGRRAAVDGGDDASGRLVFRALPNGTWIVRDWSIRVPRLLEILDGSGRTMRYDVRGYVEEGGTVTRIATSAGVFLDVTGTSVHGTVTDSAGRPAAGARVWIEGTDLAARTDREGGFTLDDLGAGTWSLRATHPALARYGHPGSRADVDLERDGVRQVRLSLPSLESFVAERCRARAPVDAGGGSSLIGRVVDSAGRPVPDAAVRVVWTRRAGAYGGSAEGYGTDADSIGVFTVCEVPPDRVVLVRASSRDEAAGEVVVRLPDRAAVVATEVRLARSSDAGIASRRAEAAREGEEEAAWLASVGFDIRGERALLHRWADEILALDYDSLPELLAEVDRLEVRRLVTGETQFRLHPAPDWRRHPERDESCALELYLNGSLVRQRIDQVWDISLHRMLEPRHVSAVEVYDGPRAPVGRPESCGAILFWVARLRHRDDPDFTGRLRGRLVGLDSIPADAVELRVEPGGRVARPSEQGRFDLGMLPPARYRIDATIPGWGTWTTWAELRARATVDVTIEVERPGGRRDR